VREACESGLKFRMQSELDELHKESQFRTLDNPSGINLYSNDYLGLAQDPRLKRAAMQSIEAAESVGSTGSRLLSGNSREWEQIEKDFAQFLGTEAALYFSSGYSANVGLISAIAGRGDIVFSDELNHASLIDGIRLSRAEKVIYPHRDLDFLAAALQKHRAHPGAKLIVTESIFSMEGDIAPIEQIVELARKYGADVVVDEAHALGVYGPRGRGVCASLALEREVFATVHTCGKALASAGAFVCGGRLLRDYLINRARSFIFSTAMPPYMAGQIRAALELAFEADGRRDHLRSIANELRTSLAVGGVNCGGSASQIIPVCLGSNEAALSLAAHLQEAGFAVRAIRPPTVPAGTSRIRLSLTASISKDDIHRLALAIEAGLNTHGVQAISTHV
jgi:8-amino-7-oxononanoate synthase